MVRFQGTLISFFWLEGSKEGLWGIGGRRKDLSTLFPPQPPPTPALARTYPLWPPCKHFTLLTLCPWNALSISFHATLLLLWHLWHYLLVTWWNHLHLPILPITFLWVLSVTLSFSQLITIYMLVSPKHLSWCLTRHHYLGVPQSYQIQHGQNAPHQHFPEPTASLLQSNLRKLQTSLPIQLFKPQTSCHYSLSLTPTPNQSPSAVKSTSCTSFKSILLSAPPQPWFKHHFSLLNDWNSLLTHLSVRCLPLIPHRSQEIFLNRKSDHITFLLQILWGFPIALKTKSKRMIYCHDIGLRICSASPNTHHLQFLVSLFTPYLRGNITVGQAQCTGGWARMWQRLNWNTWQRWGCLSLLGKLLANG